MSQNANWDAIRDMRDVLHQAVREHPNVKTVWSMGNDVVVDFGDGSQVTWTPTITKDGRLVKREETR